MCNLFQLSQYTKEYMFEGDIVLQKDQAIRILRSNLPRKKRKLDADVTAAGTVKKWSLPLNYIFDGTHSK